MEIFGRYQLLHRVAMGGMAEIFLARSASIDGFEKDLVIKRIRPELSQDATFSSMFIDEAKISISLTHQNIVHVFDFGQHADSYYLAMEHIHGCDLDAISDLSGVAGRGVDPPLALYIIREVCRGLEHAHHKRGRRGEPLHIIHRDISPQNIMISFAGEVKLTDFGIAKAKGRLSQTEPGMVLGKLSYMSPEHATGREIDLRADIFAVGVVLWELLVGERVYAGKAGPDLFRRIRHAEIDPPSRRSHHVPAELDSIVMRAVARDPADRYGSAREFGNDLHSYLSRHHPEVSSYDLEAFLESSREELGIIGFDDLEEVHLTPTGAPQSVRPAGVAGKAAPPSQASHPAGTAAAIDWTPDLIASVESFRQRPSLWQLLSLGDACAKADQGEAATAIYRVVAVKFAQRGLFAQSLLCCKRMLNHNSLDQVRGEIEAMPELAGRSNLQIATNLFKSEGPVERLLREMLADTHPSHGLVGEGTPLLRHLDGRSFAELAANAPLRKFEPDTLIVQQGAYQQTMYMLARGRVLVYATTEGGQRVYLSSLTAGDFFGENSFFTGAPRSATIEALYPVEAFEIDRPIYDRVMRDSTAANAVLLRFYKDRIVDVMLARSPVFGLLHHEDRRAITDRFSLCVFEAGASVIREGETSSQIYLIKDGEAEVLTEREGIRDTLSTLGPGTVFGEVAALRGIPRTATVVAKTKLETLCLEGADFQAILGARPEVRKKVQDVVAKRARENLDKLVHLRPTP